MNVGQIVSVVITVLLVILGLYFAFRGAYRGIVKAAMTTGNIVLSAFLACFMSRDFTTIARDYIFPLVMWMLRLVGVGDLEQSLSEYEALLSLLPMLVGVLITPFLFLFFFVLLRAIFGFGLLFVYRPKRKTVDEEGKTVRIKRHVPTWSRVSGGAVGVVNAFLLLAVLLVPIAGYTNLACNVADEYFSEIDTSGYSSDAADSAGAILYNTLEDYVQPVREQWFINASYVTVGKPMFRHMTSTAYGKSAFNLETEAVIGIRLLRNGAGFVSSGLKQLDAESVESLHGIVDTLEESVLLPELAATFVAELCEGWRGGSSVLGLNRPGFGELMDPTFDVLLGILATADGETLVADLQTLVSAMDLLVENGVFGNRQSSEQLTDAFGKNPTLLKDLMALFEQNEHLAPMAAEFRNLCIRAVTQSLDMGNVELTGKLTDSINAYKDQPELLGQDLSGIVEDYLGDQGISSAVDDAVIDEIAGAISREFADKDLVTEADVIDFVMDYASGRFTNEEIGAIIPGYGQGDYNGQ